MVNKKKPSIPLLILGSILSGYIGYLVNGAWKQGMELADFMESLEVTFSYPLRDYYDGSTPKAVLIAIGIFLIVMVMYYTSQKNYMPGKEHGTAHFATVKEINKALKGNTKVGKKGNHRILSEHIRMDIDNRTTKINNNIMVIGGSGSKKTFGFAKPNLMQMNSSFVCTDPKNELTQSEAALLEDNGYRVKVLNLVDMAKSDGYNPFDYIRDLNDIPILISNIIGNTTPKGSTQSDPFWEKSEGMFLQSIFYYVWLEEPKKTKNMRTVMKLLREAEVAGDEPSELDKRMYHLANTSPLGVDHPAFVMYQKCMRGAGDTIRSIIISANARFAKLDNPKVLKLFDHDDMNLSELGTGVNGDEQTKTALFCVIPDNDKTYNFIVGMLYTQAFQILYRTADEDYGGELPIHVTFLLDEFANVALPDDFCSLISTMRSRSISSIIIIQNLAQLKALFKDTWETITGNCDTTIYLGGNEQSTHEYMSKLLGKATIDKKSSGETRGRQGSASRNYDVMARDLMTPDEVGSLDRNKCIIKVAGQYPIIDEKYNTLKHPQFRHSADGGGRKYEHEGLSGNRITAKPYEFIGDKSLKYYERLAAKPDSGVHIASMTYDEFLVLDEFTYNDRFDGLMDEAEADRVNESEGLSSYMRYQPSSEDDAETAGMSRVLSLIRERQSKTDSMDTLSRRLQNGEFTDQQLAEIQRAIQDGVPEEYILSYAYPDRSVIKLATYRMQYKSGTKIA